MGAWGSSPEDNDGAHDKLGVVIAPSMKKLDKLFAKQRVTTQGRWERLGALSILLESRGVAAYIDNDVMKVALDDIEEIRADGEWIDGWDSPSRVRGNLSDLKREIAPRRARVRQRRRR